MLRYRSSEPQVCQSEAEGTETRMDVYRVSKIVLAIFIAALTVNGPRAHAQRATAAVRLTLSADRKLVHEGSAVTWTRVASGSAATPGEVIRYTLRADNTTSLPLHGVVRVQPSPAGTTFEAFSATPVEGAAVSYSIDRGRSYQARPTLRTRLKNGTIRVQIAPVEKYTNVRWTFNRPLRPHETAVVSCQVRVR